MCESAERPLLRRRTLTLVASLPCLLYLAAWSSVQESPRWLLISGRKVVRRHLHPKPLVVLRLHGMSSICTMVTAVRLFHEPQQAVTLEPGLANRRVKHRTDTCLLCCEC